MISQELKKLFTPFKMYLVDILKDFPLVFIVCLKFLSIFLKFKFAKVYF